MSSGKSLLRFAFFGIGIGIAIETDSDPDPDTDTDCQRLLTCYSGSIQKTKFIAKIGSFDTAPDIDSIKIRIAAYTQAASSRLVIQMKPFLPSKTGRRQ